MFDLHKDWMELLFFVLMVIGLIIALSSPSAVISYAIIFLSGIFVGRFIYYRKNKTQFPYFMIIAGFVIGYIIGVYYGNRIIVGGLFMSGGALGYMLYDKKILTDVR